MFRYFLIYKPYLMLSQFSREGQKATLLDLGYTFPKDVYPVGRLDADSEGLLLLTNDKSLNHRLLDPRFGHLRTYYVQVEGLWSDEATAQLARGVAITVEGRAYQTLPCSAQVLDQEPTLPPRHPPIRERKSIPTTWVAVSLHEGKNRQVRKMTAAVGFPTLRLVRWQIEQASAEGMDAGAVRELRYPELARLMRLAR